MKQKTTSLLAIGILALAFSTLNVNAKNTIPVTITYKTIKLTAPAKKLIVTGNVEVTIVQDVESKKLYTNNGQTKVNVYSTDNTIFVSGKKNRMAGKVTVYVTNISRIDVADNAVVTTKNTLNLQYLQVILKDNAQATINANTESIFTQLANETSLKISGNTKDFSASTNELSNLDTSKLTAEKADIERRNLHNFAKTN